jgi:hypothetical protein
MNTRYKVSEGPDIPEPPACSPKIKSDFSSSKEVSNRVLLKRYQYVYMASP